MSTAAVLADPPRVRLEDYAAGRADCPTIAASVAVARAEGASVGRFAPYWRELSAADVVELDDRWGRAGDIYVTLYPIAPVVPGIGYEPPDSWICRWRQSNMGGAATEYSGLVRDLAAVQAWHAGTPLAMREEATRAAVKAVRDVMAQMSAGAAAQAMAAEAEGGNFAPLRRLATRAAAAACADILSETSPAATEAKKALAAAVYADMMCNGEAS